MRTRLDETAMQQYDKSNGTAVRLESPYPWRLGAGIAAYVGALAVWLLVHPAPPAIVVSVDAGAQILAPFVALAIWSGELLWSRRIAALLRPRSAALVGVGLLGEALGEILTLAYSLKGSVPTPSWADAALLAMYPVFLSAILLLPVTGPAAPSRRRVALDGAMVVAALATCSWPFLLGPTLLREGQALAGALVTATYPVGDLLLLSCMVVRWTHLDDRALRPALTIFTLALGAVVTTDSSIVFQSLHGGYAPGGLIDIGGPLGMLLAGLGARTLRRTAEAQDHGPAGQPSSNGSVAHGYRPPCVWQSLLPYATLFPAFGVLVYVWRTPGDARLTSGAVMSALVLVALVVVRQVVALLDNARLYRTLDESQQQLYSVVTQTPVVLFVLDRDGIFRLAEGQGLQALGLVPHFLYGRTISDAFRNQPSLLAHAQRALAGEALTTTARLRERVFEIRFTPRHDATGAVEGVIGVALDVTERTQAIQRLQESEQRYRSLVDHHPDAVFALDRDGRFISVNAASAATSGYTIDELLALPSFAPLVSPEDLERVQASFVRTLGGEPDRIELDMRHRDGHRVALDVTSVPIVVDDDVVGVFGISRDVTAYKQAQEELVRQATHDALTGLPNRTLLQDRLEQAIGALSRSSQPCALLLLDLDRFKEINDTAGHAQGDDLLCQVAARLRAALRGTDTVARLGGDEFAVLLPGADRDGALAAAKAIHAALEVPVTLGERTVHIAASVGIAVAPNHGTDAATLMRRADVAMYVAKRSALTAAVYASEYDADGADRLALVEELRRALAEGDLHLHYQPKVELATGAVCGVEALTRWRHRTRGIIPPDVFIPLAEQSGLIGSLTAWSMDTALRQAQAWLRAARPIPVAVNLSVANLRDPHLVETIAELLRRHEVPASLLRLELTENVVMIDSAATHAALAALAELGVGLSIDDFGTGYSSLAYLKKLPVDEIKIDKAFVCQMATDVDDAAIVASTVGLAHSLGLRVVAEGVEDGEALATLTGLGCDIAQGYHLSCPLPVADFERWWRSREQDMGSSFSDDEADTLVAAIVP